MADLGDFGPGFVSIVNASKHSVRYDEKCLEFALDNLAFKCNVTDNALLKDIDFMGCIRISINTVMVNANCIVKIWVC